MWAILVLVLAKVSNDDIGSQIPMEKCLNYIKNKYTNTIYYLM